MTSSFQTIKTWISEAKKAGTFALETENHHLFLVLKSHSKEEWIVLLGKRREHFPFFGTRFENATFYNVAKKTLHHAAEEEMKDLKFDLKEKWFFTGKKPFEFSFSFSISSLKKRTPFLGTSFKYFSLQLESGHIQGEAIEQGYGFSEQGKMPVLTLKDWQVPFHYQLYLNDGGKRGSLTWGTQEGVVKNIVGLLPSWLKKVFLKDHWSWGAPFPKEEEISFEVLATTFVPLKDWTLKREIVRSKNPKFKKIYGLREEFIPGSQ